MKKTVLILMALAITAALAGCSGNGGSGGTTTAPDATQASTQMAETKAPDTQPSAETARDLKASGDTLRVGSLKGPTSMGLVSLMDKADRGEASGSYEFTMVTAADELVGKMVSGDLDIALVPANMASILYGKTNQGIRVIDINTLGVLYVVTGNDTVKSIADLKGKTIYLTGKGTTPDYVLSYLLSANGLTAGDVTLEYKSEAAEIAALLKEKPEAVGLLPQPFATVAMAQNETLKLALDLTKEWDNVDDPEKGSLVTGVTVCRNEILTEKQDLVTAFLSDHKASSEFINNNAAEGAKLVAGAGIIEKAPVAEKAIPYCGITYIDGKEMQTMLEGYLKVLHNLDPKTVGGTLPNQNFYYIP